MVGAFSVNDNSSIIDGNSIQQRTGNVDLTFSGKFKNAYNDKEFPHRDREANDSVSSYTNLMHTDNSNQTLPVRNHNSYNQQNQLKHCNININTNSCDSTASNSHELYKSIISATSIVKESHAVNNDETSKYFNCLNETTFNDAELLKSDSASNSNFLPIHETKAYDNNMVRDSTMETVKRLQLEAEMPPNDKNTVPPAVYGKRQRLPSAKAREAAEQTASTHLEAEMPPNEKNTVTPVVSGKRQRRPSAKVREAAEQMEFIQLEAEILPNEKNIVTPEVSGNRQRQPSAKAKDEIPQMASTSLTLTKESNEKSMVVTNNDVNTNAVNAPSPSSSAMEVDHKPAPKKRGRKRGSKVFDEAMSQRINLSPRALLSTLNVGIKKVKTTKELFAEIGQGHNLNISTSAALGVCDVVPPTINLDKGGEPTFMSRHAEKNPYGNRMVPTIAKSASSKTLKSSEMLDTVTPKPGATAPKTNNCLVESTEKIDVNSSRNSSSSGMIYILSLYI